MANETTSSTISELYTEIITEALFVASERSLMRGLVKNYSISGGGKSVEVPIYAAVSEAAVNEAIKQLSANIEQALNTNISIRTSSTLPPTTKTLEGWLADPAFKNFNYCTCRSR